MAIGVFRVFAGGCAGGRVVEFASFIWQGLSGSTRGGRDRKRLCAGSRLYDVAVIIGVGIDVVDVGRFMAALDRSTGLRNRLFTVAERDLPAASLAARFAAKEAIAKALGAPGNLHWHDVTVRRGPGTAPEVEAVGTVAARAAELGVSRWHLSLSHDAGIASAMVVAEGDG